MLSRFFIHISALLVVVSCLAQEKTTFSGTVKDIEGNVLEGANIVLYPQDRTIPLSFAVSGKDGGFRINVQKNIEYTLNITFMGFEPLKETIVFIQNNTTRDYVLKEALNELQEVVVNYTPPIKVKKDTTSYQVDAFVNGKERKLGAVLKKLPGIYVNKEGDVFFKNKKVGAVMVEDRTFFTGQPKMATKNIPADVVSEVQMIEDYNETPFLKEFENSDELVMNIKLKEGKENFLFGDIEAGVGYKDRYRFHPSIFKYSPTVVHNLIGDMNNTPTRSFTLSDYLAIDGEKDIQGIIDVYDSPIGKFLQNTDYYDNNHYFGGYNFQYNPNDIHEFRAFALGMSDRTLNEDMYNYTYQPSQDIENRIKNLTGNNKIYYGKMKYKYTPDLYTVVKLDVAFDKSNLESDGINISDNAEDTRHYTVQNTQQGERFLMNANVDKWFSGKNVSSAKLSFYDNREFYTNRWHSAYDIFSESIPLSEVDTYKVIDEGERKYTNLDLDLKHHYRPFRTNIVTFGFNAKLQKSSLDNFAVQDTGQPQYTFISGFSNDFGSLLNELNTSVTHKWYIGKPVIVDFGVVFQNVFWKDRHALFENTYYENNILPVGKIEWNFDEKKSLELSYNMSVSNPRPNSRLSGNTITDFNLITEGNPYLMQTTTERALLSFSATKAYGFSLYTKLGYRKHKEPIIQNITSDGIAVGVSSYQLDNSTDSYDVSVNGSYKRKYWGVSLYNTYFYKNGISIFNGEQTFNNSVNVNSDLRFRTEFEEFPNIELTMNNSFYKYSNPYFENRTFTTDVDFSASYDYKDWKFEMSFFQNFYSNKSQSNSSYFNLIGAKVFYHKEDSPFEIGVEAYNLGNNISQSSNQYNSLYFMEHRRRVFPRTVMVNLNYKL
ncbi:carboxypeptidase-like regulatory domain-containing protein [Maribacter sp. MMG018]|uniref:carboxypeptidase-like regulatory domain-containing protein n=1 Tax=Maribacter sp. MMG018 TaxID=2822688 RepID=UPI001B35CE69|nr:carboxypeptidase-like regulatory domain-containing protein [Maribacter sp. MMG018]MBQ4915929.1 carboxypeptidase-like regulatory domain-containing protein [Maribacter sp. MMG018]